VRRDDYWEIEFDGQAVLVRHRKGFDDLAALLSSPGTERAAIDLVGAAISEGDVGEVLDRTARRQYEQRIRDVQAELVEAEDHHDIGRVDRLTEELDALVDQLAGAVGLGHRSRRTGGTTERARTAVTRRIRLAIAHVLDVHPAAGRHLDASVRTGTFCVYQPERPTEWAVRS
jgi:hypothetical protein